MQNHIHILMKMFSEKNGFRLQVHVFVAQIFVSHKKPFSVHGMLLATLQTAFRKY